MKLVLQVATGIVLAVGAMSIARQEWHRWDAARDQARITAHVKETCESKRLSRERDFDHFMCSGWPAPTKP